jgi:hypothetical protein
MIPGDDMSHFTEPSIGTIFQFMCTLLYVFSKYPSVSVSFFNLVNWKYSSGDLLALSFEWIMRFSLRSLLSAAQVKVSQSFPNTRTRLGVEVDDTVLPS